jgi:hypothetical protein
MLHPNCTEDHQDCQKRQSSARTRRKHRNETEKKTKKRRRVPKVVLKNLKGLQSEEDCKAISANWGTTFKRSATITALRKHVTLDKHAHNEKWRNQVLDLIDLLGTAGQSELKALENDVVVLRDLVVTQRSSMIEMRHLLDKQEQRLEQIDCKLAQFPLLVLPDR